MTSICRGLNVDFDVKPRRRACRIDGRCWSLESQEGGIHILDDVFEVAAEPLLPSGLADRLQGRHAERHGEVEEADILNCLHDAG